LHVPNSHVEIPTTNPSSFFDTGVLFMRGVEGERRVYIQ
jgi:hypothetical protein